MQPNGLATEVILTNPRQSLGKLQLDWTPQPGDYLDIEGKTYSVLERRHKYQFKAGRYHLNNIVVYVQKAQRPLEQSLVAGSWVIGDATCDYNAHSEIIRCAVNPDGPCESCRFYENSGSI